MIIPIETNIFPQKKGVYIVGGSIRDLLAGREPADYDLAIAHDPDIFVRSMAARTGGHVAEIGKHGRTTLRVVTKNVFFDILPLNGGSIEADLLQRDFTLNAMALDLSSGTLIDPLNGQQDLAAGLVRMVSPDVFRKDPVRLIRAYRMAAAFSFSITEKTESVIRRDADLIRRSAGERIREELFKIFKSDGSHLQISRMATSRLLFNIFPELRPLEDCRTSSRRSSSYLDQTLIAYQNFENLLDSRRLNLAKPARRIYKDLNAERSAVIKCAILLHNIGRPVVQQIDSDGHVRFFGHAAKSAAMAQVVCERLRCSRRQRDHLSFIIRHHQRPFFLFNAQRKKGRVDRGFIRLFMKCGRLTPDVLLHALAQPAGPRPAGHSMDPNFSTFVAECLVKYYSILLPKASRPQPLTGHDLIKEFKLKPSPLFKRILKYVEEENLARSNLSRRQALELVRKRLDADKQQV
jgi:tRNA nucleotidyltransferase/poly(A) polymerase